MFSKNYAKKPYRLTKNLAINNYELLAMNMSGAKDNYGLPFISNP